MGKDDVKDITIEVLKDIRKEIGLMRQDMNIKFEQVSKELESIKGDIRIVVNHFDRDYMLLANKLGELEGRFNEYAKEHKSN